MWGIIDKTQVSLCSIVQHLCADRAPNLRPVRCVSRFETIFFDCAAMYCYPPWPQEASLWRIVQTGQRTSRASKYDTSTKKKRARTGRASMTRRYITVRHIKVNSFIGPN
ncbi:unnamed protein product [Amoebophrya sp. A25]|nr:unnamed protein product [Amoebophrya sp. A25]|eukprot:GSA25T00005090001.1